MSDVPSPPWYADERFWRVVQPWLFPEPFLIAASYEVDSILEMTGQPNGCRVLDLACGLGRTALQFARRGALVTGVDLNQSYLDAARADAERADLDIEWVRADMRESINQDTFDLAVCLYNSFGYFEDAGDDARVLENVYESLKEGGRFVLDHLGREICEHAVQDEPYVETRGGLTVEHRAELREDNSLLRCEWIVTGQDVDERFVTEQRVYSADDLSSLLNNAGFRFVECFGGFERNAYTRESSRLLAVAHA